MATHLLITLIVGYFLFMRIVRWYSLKFIWKAKRAKMSELNDILTAKGIPTTIRLHARFWGATRNFTFYVGTSQLKVDGGSQPFKPKLYLKTSKGRVILFITRKPGGLYFDDDGPFYHKNIIVLQKDGCFAFKKRLFGFFPERLLTKHAEKNGLVSRVYKNAALDTGALRSLVDTKKYKELLEKVNPAPRSKDLRGELFKLNIGRDEPLVLVRFKDLHLNETYVHRVPSDMDTPTEAVAWMFHKTPETYRPDVES